MSHLPGADWEHEGTGGDSANYAVTVESNPITGSVTIPLKQGDTRAIIAKRLADKWNAEQPLQHVFAVAEGSITAFVLTGPLAEVQRDGNGQPVLRNGEFQYLHRVTEMAVTWGNGTKRVMKKVGEAATSPVSGARVRWIDAAIVRLTEQSAETSTVTGEPLEEQEAEEPASRL